MAYEDLRRSTEPLWFGALDPGRSARQDSSMKAHHCNNCPGVADDHCPRGWQDEWGKGEFLVPGERSLNGDMGWAHVWGPMEGG
jgi:hypothetical protein